MAALIRDGWERRKAGDKRDCYEVFTKMVNNGDFPDNLHELLIATQED